MFNKKSFTAFSAALLLATFVSCTAATPALPTVPPDGQALFEGIFFGEGIVGQRLPEIWHGKSVSQRADSAEAAQEIDLLRLNIVQKLERTKPVVFSGSLGRCAVAITCESRTRLRMRHNV
ncbi:MAG: hypothetical protein HC933_03715 [Pleurocapsa sp. SU_196_0]|nr:hypothetical protein [Pleurocapsa sp. SU_196_0]